MNISTHFYYSQYIIFLGNCCRHIKVSSTDMKNSKLPNMMGYYTLYKSRLNESENQDPKFEGRDIWKNGNDVYLYQDLEGFWSVSNQSSTIILYRIGWFYFVGWLIVCYWFYYRLEKIPKVMVISTIKVAQRNVPLYVRRTGSIPTQHGSPKVLWTYDAVGTLFP